jgi:hypothetical protein
MRLLDGQRARPFFWSALLASLAICSGCVSSSKTLFTATGPGWHVQEGQALWRPGRSYPEIGGDLVFVTHQDGRSLVQFAKTPMSLVSGQTTSNRWLIQFPPRHLGFSGRRPAPTRFAWLYLAPALAGEPLPPAFRFEREPEGAWRLENTHTGETLEGFLAP